MHPIGIAVITLAMSGRISETAPGLAQSSGHNSGSNHFPVILIALLFGFLLARARRK